MGDMLIRIFLLISLAAVCAAAQTRTFKWTDELCEYSGTYDARKVTAKQLQNTYDLLLTPDASFAADAAVFQIEDIARLDVAKLDAEYAKRSAALKTADIVKKPYWQNLRAKKLKILEQTYRLARVEMLAFNEPSALTQYKDAPACSTRYADPLIAGGDSLLAAWVEVNQASRKVNADPERVRRVYEEKLASNDRMRYAFIEVMGFGFHNCANQLIDYVTLDGSQAAEFKKLFKSVKTISCDEP